MQLSYSKLRYKSMQMALNYVHRRQKMVCSDIGDESFVVVPKVMFIEKLSGKVPLGKVSLQGHCP